MEPEPAAHSVERVARSVTETALHLRILMGDQVAARQFARPQAVVQGEQVKGGCRKDEEQARQLGRVHRQAPAADRRNPACPTPRWSQAFFPCLFGFCLPQRYPLRGQYTRTLPGCQNRRFAWPARGVLRRKTRWLARPSLNRYNQPVDFP